MSKFVSNLSLYLPQSSLTAFPSPVLVPDRVGGMYTKKRGDPKLNLPTTLYMARKNSWRRLERGHGAACYHCGSWSNVPCPEGRYVTFRERESWKAMSSAASSLRSSTKPSPASIRELAMSKAAWESPSAEMMAACFCCSAYKHKNIF